MIAVSPKTWWTTSACFVGQEKRREEKRTETAKRRGRSTGNEDHAPLEDDEMGKSIKIYLSSSREQAREREA